jgi:hypothetical protein
MPIDNDLKADIQKEIDLLESLQKEVGAAIGRAKDKITEVEPGKTREQVFSRKK